MWGKSKENKEEAHNLIFVFPARQGHVEITKAEYTIIKNIAKKRDMSFEDATLLLLRLAIKDILELAVKKTAIITAVDDK